MTVFRWSSSSAQHKPHKSISADKIRKNSNFSLNHGQQSHLAQFQQQYQDTQPKPSNNLYSLPTQNPTSNYNKSSSYPNFNSANQITITTSNSNSCSNNSTTTTTTSTKTTELHQHPVISTTSIVGANNYHRHSLNNLISTTMLAHLQQSQPQLSSNFSQMSINNKENQRSSSNDGVPSSQGTSTGMIKAAGGRDGKSGPKNIQSIGDINSINSRLEFLCLQMTEQAIN